MLNERLPRAELERRAASGKVGKDRQYEEIARGIQREEYDRALALAAELGLRLDPRSVGERRLLARAV